jgi:2-isopropylmalate synthase
MGRPKGKGRAKPMKKISLYDTTLRDGTQSETVSLSVMDKVAITEKLDEFGIHYIEGGYPGSNPKDKEFFDRGRNLRLKKAKLCAFGMTRRVGKKVEEDSNMKALLSAETPVITVVGKSWDFHVTEALRTTLPENLKAIRETIEFLKKRAEQVFYDAWTGERTASYCATPTAGPFPRRWGKSYGRSEKRSAFRSVSIRTTTPRWPWPIPWWPWRTG